MRPLCRYFFVCFHSCGGDALPRCTDGKSESRRGEMIYLEDDDGGVGGGTRLNSGHQLLSGKVMRGEGDGEPLCAPTLPPDPDRHHSGTQSIPPLSSRLEPGFRVPRRANQQGWCKRPGGGCEDHRGLRRRGRGLGARLPAYKEHSASPVPPQADQV